MAERRIIISETAYTDLDNIDNYIAEDSPLIAQQFIRRIFERIGQLAEFPESGKIVPEFNDRQVRELILKRYRIVYRILHSSDILVLRIIHGARLLYAVEED